MINSKTPSLFFIILLLVSILNAYGQDTVKNLIPYNFSKSIGPDTAIASKKIRERIEYSYLEEKGKTKYFTQEIITYDNKGRIIKEDKFSQPTSYPDATPYTIKYQWISDTVVAANIYYDKKHNEKKILKVDEKSYVLSKEDSTKDYFVRAVLSLNKKNFGTDFITYLDFSGKPCFTYDNSEVNEMAEICDTVKDNSKIRSVRCLRKYSQVVCNYDSLNRIKEAFVIFYNYNNQRDTTKSDYTYYDSIRIKTIIESQRSANFVGNKQDFYYNDKGDLIKQTKDYQLEDSLINNEYIYNGDTTIQIVRELRDLNTNMVRTYEYAFISGLCQGMHQSNNRGLPNYGFIYKYKKESDH